MAIGELDAVEVEDAEGVGGDETVKREDLVHLNSGDEGATALTDDIRDSNDICKLRRERCSDGSVTEFDGRWLRIVHFRLHHLLGKRIGLVGPVFGILSLLGAVCASGLLEGLSTGCSDRFNLSAVDLGFLSRR